MKEIWKPIENFSGLYEVSNLGRVRSLVKRSYTNKKYPLILKQSDNGRGYLIVNLYFKRKHSSRMVHQLVLEAFSKKQPGLITRHLNGEQTDNRLINLVYGTHQENANDRIRHNRHAPGSRNFNAKLDEKDIRLIKTLLSKGYSQTRIAHQFKVSQSLISLIKTKKSWRHV